MRTLCLTLVVFLPLAAEGLVLVVDFLALPIVELFFSVVTSVERCCFFDRMSFVLWLAKRDLPRLLAYINWQSTIVTIVAIPSHTGLLIVVLFTFARW